MDRELTEAIQAGRLPVPPSPEALQAQQARQQQHLRAALGESGFAAFQQYQASLPDRIILEAVNRQGAGLSESQSQQLLQVLGQARQQVMSGPQPAAQDADQAMAALQRQQILMNQTVLDRVQNALTPEQTATLRTVLTEQFTITPKSR